MSYVIQSEGNNPVIWESEFWCMEITESNCAVTTDLTKSTVGCISFHVLVHKDRIWKEIN